MSDPSQIDKIQDFQVGPNHEVVTNKDAWMFQLSSTENIGENNSSGKSNQFINKVVMAQPVQNMNHNDPSVKNFVSYPPHPNMLPQHLLRPDPNYKVSLTFNEPKTYYHSNDNISPSGENFRTNAPAVPITGDSTNEAKEIWPQFEFGNISPPNKNLNRQNGESFEEKNGNSEKNFKTECLPQNHLYHTPPPQMMHNDHPNWISNDSRLPPMQGEMRGIHPQMPGYFPHQIVPWRRTFGTLGTLPPGHPMINEAVISSPPLISTTDLAAMPLQQCRDLELHIRMYRDQLERLIFFASQHAEQLHFLQKKLTEAEYSSKSPLNRPIMPVSISPMANEESNEENEKQEEKMIKMELGIKNEEIVKEKTNVQAEATLDSSDKSDSAKSIKLQEKLLIDANTPISVEDIEAKLIFQSTNNKNNKIASQEPEKSTNDSIETQNVIKNDSIDGRKGSNCGITDSVKSPIDGSSYQSQPTKNIIGKVFINGIQNTKLAFTAYQNGEVYDASIGPHFDICVVWEMPSEVVKGKKLSLGMYRESSASNRPAIVSKKLTNTTFNGQLAEGTVPFFAPKSVGSFVFRLYEDSKPSLVLATSPVWYVDAFGRDAEMTLKKNLPSFLPFEEGKESRNAIFASQQISFVFKRLKKFPNTRNPNMMTNLIKKCLEGAWAQVTAVSLEDKNEGIEEPHIRTVHGAIWGVLNAAFSNPNVINLMDENTFKKFHELFELWSPIEQRFFSSEEALNLNYIELLGIVPRKIYMTGFKFISNAKDSKKIANFAKYLAPKDEFFKKRELLKRYLEDSIVSQNEVPEIPKGTVIKIFGSSSNGFGLDCSDLDMCLMYPKGHAISKNASLVIEGISKKLSELGMSGVDCRPNARIPIVLFTDPKTGLNCDISVMNPLAVRNTELLRAYSNLDKRVQQLAYLIKYWAKKRHINSPSNGTLSSYGYILCLIHFLQTRKPPVLPNLQAIPQDWADRSQPPPIRPSKSLPEFLTPHVNENQFSNTYFFQPKTNEDVIQYHCAQNKESLLELLTEFFQYYAWDFNYCSSVVSVRYGGVVSKESKAESDNWPLHTRLSIEDPFESNYDVAHVLKWSRHRYIHAEFARAHSMICEFYYSKTLGCFDFEKICAESPVPSFLRMSGRNEDDANFDKAS